MTSASTPRLIRNMPDPQSISGVEEARAQLWLLCRTGSHRFVLPIASVVETLRALPIEALADAPRFVLGLSVVRGTPLAVLDTGALFGNPAKTHGRFVTVRVGSRTIGLAVETVVGVYALAAQSLAQLPALLGNVETIEAITTLDQELVFVLQAARAIPDDFLEKGSDAVGEGGCQRHLELLCFFPDGLNRQS